MSNNNEKHDLELSARTGPAISRITPPAKPDPLLEELQVLLLEGRYFCFDKHEAKRRKGTYVYRDGLRELIISVDPRVGHPSILAYKMLQAVFRKVTLEGKPYPDTVAFGVRELGRLVGRDAAFGGQDSQALYQAILQLQDTKIVLALYDKDGKQHRSYRFALIGSSGFVAGGEARSPSRLKAVSLRLDPVIMASMRENHFAIFNWERIGGLEALTAALYKRLYYHFSNLFQEVVGRRDLVFKKRYPDVCAQWLGGLKPERFKSRIEQQLSSHFRELVNCGLLRSVTIERTVDGADFNLVFRPGSGFFVDYETFYLGGKARQLQFVQSADAANINTPLSLTAHFYRRLHKTDSHIFNEPDVEYMRQLLVQLSEVEVRDLIDFAIEKAPTTRFSMKNIKALGVFLPEWQAERTKRQQRIERQRAEAEASRQEQLKLEYSRYIDAKVHAYLEQRSSEEMDQIKALVEEQVKDSLPAMLGINRHRAERRIALARIDVPSFDSWLGNRL